MNLSSNWRSSMRKNRMPNRPQLTGSWEAYVQAGVQLKAQTGAYLMAHARDMKDIIIRSNLKSGEGLYLDNQGKVLINTPRFERAFELARQVRTQKLDGKINAWSTEWTEGFKRGHIATQMSGAWLAGHLNNWIAPQTKGLWRAAQLPERSWASWGGSFYAIPKKQTPAPKSTP